MRSKVLSSKFMPLETAVRQIIRKGMSIHLTTNGRAALRTILREFSGKDMQLTLIMCRSGYAADLIASGIVRKVIAGSYGVVSDSYTGPMPQIQETFKSAQVEFHFFPYSL